jgi:hypothetical protein
MRWFKDRRRLTLLLLLVLFAGMLAWALRSYRQWQQLARVRWLEGQLRAAAPEQRRQQWGELRQAFAKLSPGQREALARERRQAYVKRMREFFQLSRKEQLSRLDREIKRMEQRRRDWQRQASANANNRPANRGFSDPERSDQRARSMLDRSTPEERALRSEYRQLMNQRRQQLGLSPLSGRGGRGGRG